MSWSPKIQESKVYRPDEGQAGVARQGDVTNDQTPTNPTTNSFDTGKAAGLSAAKFKRTIDTTQTDHLANGRPYDIENAG